MIPYGRQSISQADIDAVVEVLKSDFLTQGPAVPRFEQAFAEYCGALHAVAVNSATSALHIACLALGVGKGDLVWTSPITFVASANCALYCDAEVDFVDIDPATFNMSVDRLGEKLAAAERAGRLPKAVIPVHMAGQSCAMAEIHALGQRYGFAIIEDASHAVGATYRDEPVGSCHYSDIAVFSFHPVKIITTAEGGLATTNSPKLAAAMRLFRSHGITRDPSEMEREPDGGWYYEQIALGFNYRMTEIQAALGISQMNRLDAFVARRRELAARYDRSFAGERLTAPWQAPEGRSSYHLYIVRLESPSNWLDHRAAYDRLREDGIGVNLHYMPVYLQPHYRRLGFRPGHCPEAERYYAEAISIPLYYGLSEANQDRVVEAVRQVVRAS
ncbi:MAG: UDP-4-amino-4,6-dideoxy-N-acetyl-beta-L-altrosamine transaminase [Sphingomicrobium sp.]